MLAVATSDAHVIPETFCKAATGNQGCPAQAIHGSDSHVIDPTELEAAYKDQFSPEQLAGYWRDTCTPVPAQESTVEPAPIEPVADAAQEPVATEPVADDA